MRGECVCVYGGGGIKMVTAAKNMIETALEGAGFMVLSHSAQPSAMPLKNKMIAFLSLENVSNVLQGYRQYSSKEYILYEVGFSCLLLGSEGDCSDREQLHLLTEKAAAALTRAGFDVSIIDDFGIDGRLSRAKTVLKAKMLCTEEVM